MRSEIEKILKQSDPVDNLIELIKHEANRHWILFSEVKPNYTGWYIAKSNIGIGQAWYNSQNDVWTPMVELAQESTAEFIVKKWMNLPIDE